MDSVSDAHAREALSLLLGAMSRRRQQEGRRHSFFIRRPSEPLQIGGLGTEISYAKVPLLRAALYTRRHGSPHLRSLAVPEVENQLLKFISEHYHLIADECVFASFDCSYAEHLSSDGVDVLAAALATSSLFVEPRALTIFPLVPIVVEAPYRDQNFFFSAPEHLAECLGANRPPGEIMPASFPPTSLWDGRRDAPTSWLGVAAATLDAARQRRAAILGAVALLPHHLERYMFSGRSMFGGQFIIANGYSLSPSDPHTPALMTDLTIGTADAPWLDVLAGKLASPRKVDRKQMRALEYYYRAWVPDPVKRFPTLFAALDAIFGDAGAATQAVIDAVGPLMGSDYDHARIRLMLGLRASVIHGGAPNVYESSKYEQYYEAYETDATRDLELIVARCLQTVIFDRSMHERVHTYRDVIARETGAIV